MDASSDGHSSDLSQDLSPSVSSSGPFVCALCKASCITLHGFKKHQNSKKCIKNSVRNSQASVAANTATSSSATNKAITESLLDALKTVRFVPIMRRVPKSARRLTAQSLAAVIECAASENSFPAWSKILMFAAHVFQLPDGEEREESLTSRVKTQLLTFNGALVEYKRRKPRKQKQKKRPDQLMKLVDARFSEGDISGAVRLCSSEDSIAPDNQETVDSLRKKHPPASDNLRFPDPPQPHVTLPNVTLEEIIAAIKTFPHGSAGGTDGLRPQHLKDLLGHGQEEHEIRLGTALADVITLMLKGAVCKEIRSNLFGGKMIALQKKGGGIRPIAVGSMLRRLAAKIIGKRVQDRVGQKLRPKQLGYGTKGGAEAIVHAARSYVEEESDRTRVVLKLDFKNAFNCLRRDVLLESVKRDLPEYYAYFWHSYREPSNLLYGDHVIQSVTGVQQGDPVGPMGFCLGTMPLMLRLESLFAVYLDDAALAGGPSEVLADFRTVVAAETEYGLELNYSKCELFVLGGSTQERQDILAEFRTVSPLVLSPDAKDFTLLGAGITDEAVPPTLEDKISRLRVMKERLKDISAHQAYYLLRNALAIPKTLYTLRTSRAWRFPQQLALWDSTVRSAVCQMSNNDIDNRAWNEITLPTREGGARIRAADELAVSAYMASVHSVHALVSELTDFSLEETVAIPLAMGSEKTTATPPSLENRATQRLWDMPIVKEHQMSADACPENDHRHKARRLAISTPESAAWMYAVPARNLGTRLDDDVFRNAFGLRFGTKLCTSFRARCGAMMDEYGYHALSCGKCLGPSRINRHTNLNETLHRTLYSCGIPSILEPTGTSWEDSKRPDGITLTPVDMGRRVVWDVTCVDTLALTYIAEAVSRPGAAAEEAKKNKSTKYSYLEDQCSFCPIGVETLGPWGPSTKKFFNEIGRRLKRRTREPRSFEFFRQRISLDIQRGNAACLFSSLPAQKPLHEIFFLTAKKTVVTEE